MGNSQHVKLLTGTDRLLSYIYYHPQTLRSKESNVISLPTCTTIAIHVYSPTIPESSLFEKVGLEPTARPTIYRVGALPLSYFSILRTLRKSIQCFCLSRDHLNSQKVGYESHVTFTGITSRFILPAFMITITGTFHLASLQCFLL